MASPELSSIEDWNRSQKHSAYYEVNDREKNRVSGGLKAKDENWQGPGVYSISKAKSVFQKSITIDLCAHGYASDKQTPLCLIIWHFQLFCRGPKRFETAGIKMTFDNHEPGGGSHPEVINWGPFKTMEVADRTEETITTTTNVEGSAGLDYYATLDLSLSKNEQRQRQQRFFHKSWSTPVHDYAGSHRYNGVHWSFDENRSQEAGINPDFRLAVLVRPASDGGPSGRPKPFTARLEMDLQAGIWDDLSRMFKNRDPRVSFDPARPVEAIDAGKRVREEVERNLGALDLYADDGALLGLLVKLETPVTGGGG